MSGLSQLPDDLLQELMATFNVEARERLEAANRQLLALEASSDPVADAELVAEIFREVHSLKGAAAAVGLSDVRDLSHNLETLFERAREGEVLHPDVFDVVYQALDTIGSLVDQEASGAPADIDISGLLSELEAAATTGFNPSPGTSDRQSGDELGSTGAGGATRPDGDLDAAEEGSGPVPAVTESAGADIPAAADASTRAADDTIRVATAKLDSLMAQVGELLVASIGAQQRTAEAAELLELFSETESHWRESRPRYRKLLSQVASREDANGGKENPDSALGEEESQFRPWRSHAVVTPLASAHDLHHLLSFVQESDERDQVAVRHLAEFRRRLAADGRRMAQIVSDLQDEVRRTRMLPVSTIFAGFPRVVRDVARDVGKEAALVVKGGEIEVDRAVLEQIKDPLNHLLRNAVDHGLEAPDQRELEGKPVKGTITLEATQRGDSLVVSVSDDGAGIDLEKIRKTALKRGFATKDEIDAMPDRQVLDFIFRSGLSTSPIITDLSGRGVGLDVVRESVERMNGIIEIESVPGAGTTFNLTVPLAVATTHCLLVRCADRTFALPITSIARILRVARDEIGKTEGRQTLRLDERPVPIARMGEALGISSNLGDEELDGREKFPAVVLGTAEKRAALIVDELVGAQEIVVKALPQPLIRVRNVAGATIMPNGEVVLILNASDLVRAAERGTRARVATAQTQGSAIKEGAVVLVADDSIVTRALEKNILESAGFNVRVAADGMEAWSVLQTESVNLLVADVEMPRLDGFGLTEKIRDDARLRDLPVVLVTSLDSREHRERGVSVGADAHIVKQSFNQEVLLNTIRRLI